MLLKIIYIEDEPDLCQIFEDNLASSAVSISAFTNPELGLIAIEKDMPDLVFLDYRLPNTSGFEVSKRIKVQVPLVLVTGDLEIKLLPSFVRKFAKPYDFAELEAFILGFVQKKNAA